jgi:hypothetical protein
MIEHQKMISGLTESQKDDHDLREKVREAHLFVDKRDGQWEPYWWNANEGKPRYTFDLTNPIIDQIAGELEQADFDINVRPAGGDATKDTAEIFDGLVRNIENISNASHVFNQAARNMITSGMDGWRVVQKYVDGDSFDQDLMIVPISNFVDRVWFNTGAEAQDRSDATECWVLQGVSLDEYNKRWPDGSGMSVSQDRWNQAYWNQADLVIVGEYYHIEEVMRELVLMSNGAVYEDNEKFKKIADELKAIGVVEKRRRKRAKKVCHVRKFDGNDWLGPDEKTVFSYLPVIPTYANFKIYENKTIYWGVVEKLLDPQRVMNYSMSREIEEGALSPRAKYWGTPEQRKGHEATISTLNTNNNPWQDYNPDPLAPGAPIQQGGAQINPGLQMISQSMNQMINQSAGLFAANMGDNPNAQSGVAIKALQNKGDIGTIKYFGAQEVAICHTARILIDAIPAVYEGERQVRILKEDGSFDMTLLNEGVVDQETGEVVYLNDLTQGTYDTTCSSGPSFQNRQQETVASMVEVAQVDPTIIELGGDILLKNISAPGMNMMADRKRQQLLKAGVIPEDQMTDEEKEEVQMAAQQPQEPTAEMLIGQAEMTKAENEQTQLQYDAQVKQVELQQSQQKLDQSQQKLDQDGMKIQADISLRQEADNFKAGKTMKDANLAADKTESEIAKNYVDSMVKLGDAGYQDPAGVIAAVEERFIDTEFKTRLKGMPTDQLIGMVQ